MQNRWVVVLGGVLFVLVAWNTWTVQQLTQRVSTWEQSAAGIARTSNDLVSTNRAVVADASKGSGMALRNSGGPSAQQVAAKMGSDAEAPIDFENPEVREKIAQIMEVEETQRRQARQKEQTAMYLDSMVREIDTFADEFGLDSQTKASVIREVEANTKAFSAIRNDVREGRLSWFDAKDEFRVIKEDGAANLQAILGEDQYEELKGRLWGDRRWGK